MIAVERGTAPVLSGASAVVVEIQEARARGEKRRADRLANDLVVVMQPLVRKSSRFFARAAFRNGSSSLAAEDLDQVGFIEVVKSVNTFRVERAASQTFENWCYFRVKRAMKDYVRLHSGDVNVSEGAQRGRVARECDSDSVVVDSIDAETSDTENDDFSEESNGSGWVSPLMQRLLDECDPEHQVNAAQQHRRVITALRTLTRVQRDIVQRAFGVGCEEQSVREISKVLEIPRARCDGMLKQGIELLRHVLSED